MRSRDISEKQWGSEICNNLLWQIVCAKHSPPNKVISIDLKDFCDLDQLTPPLEFDLDQSCVNAKPGSVRVSDGGWRIRARAWQVSQRFFGHFLGLQSGGPTRASAASHFLNRKFFDESQRIISLFESMVSGYNFSVNDLTLRYALGNQRFHAS